MEPLRRTLSLAGTAYPFARTPPRGRPAAGFCTLEVAIAAALLGPQLPRRAVLRRARSLHALLVVSPATLASGLGPAARSICAALYADHSHDMTLGFLSGDTARAALLRIYSQFGELRDVDRTFDSMMMMPGLESWNHLMSCNLRYGRTDQVLNRFSQLVRAGLTPTEITFSIALESSTVLGDLKQGAALHGSLLKQVTSLLKTGYFVRKPASVLRRMRCPGKCLFGLS